jgi:replication-associated recombination protein RarA
MHAYLILSDNKILAREKIVEITTKKKLDPHPFNLKKIEDLRNLASFVKLHINKPTAIIIDDIDNANIETLNGFLKNLEEPQKTMSYILTAQNQNSLPPTIVSRCQLLYCSQKANSNESKFLKDFLYKTPGQKLKFVSEIKDRSEAYEFVKKLITQAQNAIHLKSVNYQNAAQFIKKANNSAMNIKANGNVSLQLTNFVLNLE